MFLSTATNTVDAKGRTSVPANFRAAIAQISTDQGTSEGGFDGVVVWPSFDGDYLEGGGIALLREYERAIEALDYYDEARIALQQAIFAECRHLPFDANGRISLPKDFADYAGIDGKATFVGLGRRFEIWNPEAHAANRARIRDLARANRHQLRSTRPLPTPPAGPAA